MFGTRLCSILLNSPPRCLSKTLYVRFLTTATDTEAKNVPSYKTLLVSVPKPFVYHVELNRPDKLNAMSNEMWDEIKECFDSLDDNADCRAVLLSGKGRGFTSGLDFQGMLFIGEKISQHTDIARKAKVLLKGIPVKQRSLSSIEECSKPVISLVNGFCVGAGVDMICASDIRYCTEDAIFQVKEIDIGLAADCGTLQRLPKIVGSTSLTNELCFTARKFDAKEAKEYGLVNRVFKDKDSLIAFGIETAENIAAKSPVAVQGTKRSLVFSRDHTVQEGLNHIALWNQTMIQSEDFITASTALATRSPTPPEFDKL